MVKKFFIGLVFFFALLIVLLIFYIWFFIFDVTGLKFYDDEPISDFYITEDSFIIVTDDGQGYISSKHLGGGRKETNALSYYDDRFQTLEPVRFFDGKIKEVFVSEPMSFYSLFITDNDELYSLRYLETEKICDNITYATYYFYAKTIYAINKDADLLAIDQNKNSKVIYSGVLSVEMYKDRILVLTQNGDLCELSYSDGLSGYEVSSVLYSGVKRFEVDRKYNEHKVLPLMSVLTVNGELYVKGEYFYSCSNILTEPVVKYYIYDEWTLISSDVTDFASSTVGTVYALNDGSVHYLGYDIDNNPDELRHTVLPVSNAKTVLAVNHCVVVIDENNKLIGYGDYIYNLLFTSKREARIFEDDPLIIELP